MQFGYWSSGYLCLKGQWNQNSDLVVRDRVEEKGERAKKQVNPLARQSFWTVVSPRAISSVEERPNATLWTSLRIVRSTS